MSPTEISLIAVTVAFIALVVWVYWPSRRQHLESHGSIPLDDEPENSQKTNKEKQQ